MKIARRRSASTLAILAAAAALGLAGAPSRAQDAWPSKPIRLIVPSGPASASDFNGRTFGQWLQTQLKQTILIDNKPGAGAIIGSEALRASAPDGYTYLVGGSSVSAANPVLYAKLPYDPVKDFEEVGLMGVFPIIGMARKDGPIRSVADIISLAKARPGKISYGYYSALAQVSPEIIRARTGIDILAASYKNVGQISTDIAGGVIDFTFLDAIGAAPVLKSGLLRAIAVTSPQRIASMPDVPAVAETLPGFEVQGWQGLTAVKGTPLPILERMNALLRAMQNDPPSREALERQGVIVRPTAGLAEHATFVAADRARWVEWARIAKFQRQ